MASESILLIFPAANVKTFGSNESDGAQREKTISPPLGILYLAAALTDAGRTVECCDYNAEDYSPESLYAYASRAQLVGISMLSFNRVHSAQIIAELNARFPGLPVIAGGPDLILHPRLIAGTRLSCIQEAEDLIVPIVNAVLENGDLAQIPGIVYPGPDGSMRSGLPYEYNDNLDRLRFPRRELLRDNKGYTIIGKRESRKVTAIITSRGCPKKCAFCAHGAIAYQKYRRRSAENVLEELRAVAAQGYRIVGIVDDNFTADKPRAMKIMQGIIDMKAGFTMAVQGRVDAADYELFRLMRKAGVVLITFGLESGNQDVLDFYDKGVTVEQNRNAIVLADRAGLYAAGLFIMGAPFETEEHFRRTYEFAARNPLDVTSFWVLDYTFGSRLWRDAREKGALTDDEFNVPAGSERGTSPYPTRHIEALTERYFFMFYRRPSYWLRQIGKVARVHNRYFITVLLVGIYWLLSRRLQLLFGRTRGEKRP